MNKRTQKIRERFGPRKPVFRVMCGTLRTLAVKRQP